MFDINDTPVDLDATADQIVSEIPEPQQHAIDQATADAAADPEAPNPSVEVDALGIPWDPSQHSTGADGKGVRTAKGTWRRRRGLKGSASHVATGAAGAAPKESPEVIQQRTHEHQCRIGGAMAATMLMRMSVAVGGVDFLPREMQIPGGVKISEEKLLQEAFGDYFVAKGIVEISPGWMLLSALSFYYLPRFQSPEVRKRAGGLYGWVKNKVGGVVAWWKYGRKGKKKPEKAQGNGAAPAPRVEPEHRHLDV